MGQKENIKNEGENIKSNDRDRRAQKEHRSMKNK